MLTAKKTKLHGMKDSRWSTKDKISQYRGLVNLFRRDKQIASTDVHLIVKKEKFMLSRLKKELANSRQSLENATVGDRQMIRNTLQENRNLQLAFSHLEVEKIIEHIHQENFTRRKELDLLKHKMGEKSNYLINLKLNVEDMRDRLIFFREGTVSEFRSKEATAKVQDAILKKEAAVVVNESYKKILAVLKKDQIYFDAILIALRVDGLKQNKCMLDAIVLGQLAKEYLDNRTKEFQSLEKYVKTDMAMRKDCIMQAQEMSKSKKNVRHLIRRDSEFFMSPTNMQDVVKETNKNIEDTELTFILATLEVLRGKLFISKYDELFPCIIHQFVQKERLEKLKEQFMEGRDVLLHKTADADVVYCELYNTTNETMMDYKQTKKLLTKQIKKEMHEAKVTKEQINKKNNLILVIRPRLSHLEEMCKIVELPKKRISTRPTFQSELFTKDETIDKFIDDGVKSDGQEIVKLLAPKLEMLTSKESKPLDPLQRDTAQILMEQLLFDRSACVDVRISVLDVSLVEDLEIDDSSVLSRKDIKNLSKKMVLINTVNEDLIPMYAAPRRRRKKFK